MSETPSSERRRRPWGERTLARALIVLLALSPWAFGLVHERWVAAFGVAIAALALPLYRRSAPLPGVLAALLGLPLAWGALHLLPLPAATIRVLSPERDRFLSMALSDLPLSPSSMQVLSLQPGDTLRSMGIPAAAALLLLGLHGALTHRVERQFLRLALVVSAVGVTGLGLLQQFFQSPRIYWISSVPQTAPAFFGTFVCPNHYGILAALALALVAGGVVNGAGEEEGRSRSMGKKGSGWIWWMAGAVLSAGMLLSTSDGAVALLVAVPLGVGWGHALVRGRRGVAVGLLGGALTIGLLLLGPLSSYRERLAHSLGVRWAVWGDAALMGQRFQPLGIGGGAFSAVFPHWQRSGGYVRFVYPENSYLEALVTGGWPYLLLLAGIGALVIREGGIRFQRAGSAGRLAMVPGVVGLVALGAHAAFDFDLAIGSIRLWGTAFLALTLASFRERHRRRGLSGEESASLAPAGRGGTRELPRWPGRLLAVAALLTGGLSGMAGVLGGASGIGEEAEASTLSPWFGAFASAARHEKSGQEKMRQAREELDRREVLLAEGERHILAALAQRPADSALHVAYGWCHLYQDRREEAEKSLRTALALFPEGPYEFLYLARFLRIQHRESEGWEVLGGAIRRWPAEDRRLLFREFLDWPQGEDAWRGVFEAAGAPVMASYVRFLVEAGEMDLSARSAALGAKMFPNSLDLSELHAVRMALGGDAPAAEEKLRAVLRRDPQRTEAILHLGRLLQDQGRAMEAIPLLRQALEASPGDPSLRWRLAEARFQGGEEKSLAVLQAMAEEDPPGRLAGRLADLLRERKRCHDAMRWYRLAGSRDPHEAAWPVGVSSCLARLGRPGEGEAELRKWIRQGPPQRGEEARKRLMVAGELELVRRLESER